MSLCQTALEKLGSKVSTVVKVPIVTLFFFLLLVPMLDEDEDVAEFELEPPDPEVNRGMVAVAEAAKRPEEVPIMEFIIMSPFLFKFISSESTTMSSIPLPSPFTLLCS